MHWTYAPIPDGADLEQGDYVEATQELRAILRTVHPYFAKEQYLGFMITTQSCDLVRRGGRPKAPHISIASVRSLPLVLPRLLELVLRPVAPAVYLKSKKNEAKMFLERLLDQNEQTLGLFYLHPDSSIGLAEPAVAFLRVTVALKADHYGLLVASRRGRLHSEFRGKFGWLVGNLYARAASPDWSDQPGGVKAKRDLVSGYLEATEESGPHWLDDIVYEAVEQQQVPLPDEPGATLLRTLEKYRPPPLAKQLASESAKQAKDVVNRLLGPLRERVVGAREAAVALVDAEPEAAVDRARELIERLSAVEAALVALDSAHDKLEKRLSSNAVVARILRLASLV